MIYKHIPKTVLKFESDNFADILFHEAVRISNIDGLNEVISKRWEFVAVDGDYWLVRKEEV